MRIETLLPLGKPVAEATKDDPFAVLALAARARRRVAPGVAQCGRRATIPVRLSFAG